MVVRSVPHRILRVCLQFLDAQLRVAWRHLGGREENVQRALLGRPQDHFPSVHQVALLVEAEAALQLADGGGGTITTGDEGTMERGTVTNGDDGTRNDGTMERWNGGTRNDGTVERGTIGQRNDGTM